MCAPLLKRRWLAFVRSAASGVHGGPGRPEEAFAALNRLYARCGRHYHGWAHVAACLRELRRCAPGLRRYERLALEMAIWFHDAIYEPGAADNEEASARLATSWGRELGVQPAVVRAAGALILATRHGSGREPFEPDRSEGLLAAAALMRDIDLAVLGSRPGRYGRYARRIRREYETVPHEQFRQGRSALLRALLGGAQIYATPEFRRRYESRARRNLGRELARLEARTTPPPDGPAPGGGSR